MVSDYSNRKCLRILGAVTLLLVMLASGAVSTLYAEPTYGRGLIEPAFEPHRMVSRKTYPALSYPTRFDWREQNVLTPVRHQGSCGACYAFAFLGEFESQMLISDGVYYDFSENNLKECEWFRRTGHHPSGCEGGTAWRVVNLLADRGTVLETCDGYLAYNSVCKDWCSYIKTVLNWRVFSLQEIPAVSVMKSYIQAHGPIFVAMYAGSNDAWKQEFLNYDGSYTLHHVPGSSRIVNHAVVVVGWDDTLSYEGGQGAWIVKNSWGSNWGGTCGHGTERGYFTIAYNSAKLGQYASYTEEWQRYDPNSVLLYYDEAGYYYHYGTGRTGWGMCKFVPDTGVTVERVELWTTDATEDIDISIYDDFNGYSLSNPITSEENRSYDEMGYMSIELTSPFVVSAGDDIYVAVKIKNTSLDAPLAFDPANLGEKAWGKCYISDSGGLWSEFTDGDLGIRIRVRIDDDPPDSVSFFGAVAGDTTVTLSWLNPGDSDLAHTLIVYSDSGYPNSAVEGIPIENGSEGKVFGEAAQVDTAIHSGLENNVTYYYSAFAVDSARNHSVPAHLSAMPVDTIPPARAAAFSAEGSDRSVKLKWTTPEDIDVTEVLILYSDELPPTPAGLPVENGAGGIFDAAAAAVDSFTHTGLLNDTTYFYSICVLDEMGNRSDSLLASAMTEDIVPPTFSISVFQNPYISNHLDIYAIPSEPIVEATLDVILNEHGLQPSVADEEAGVYRCDYDVYQGGKLKIGVCAEDLKGNHGCSEDSLTASLVAAGGGTVRSADGNFEMIIPQGTIRRDACVLISEAVTRDESLSRIYDVSPTGLSLYAPVTVSIAFGGVTAFPERLCIAEFADGAARAVESYVDRDRGRIVAYVSQLSAYGLVESDEAVSDDLAAGEFALFQNAPNPFEAKTSLRYLVARQSHVRLEVLSVGGRLVRLLSSGFAVPGVHRVEWDGKDGEGRRVAGGVYFYRLTTEMGTATRKMVMLR
jgi:C1A family cysteine protease